MGNKLKCPKCGRQSMQHELVTDVRVDPTGEPVLKSTPVYTCDKCKFRRVIDTPVRGA